MANHKILREIQELAAQSGCKVLSIRHSKHLRIQAQRPDGTIGMMTHPVSPSDSHAIKNQIAHWRQFAAGCSHHHNRRDSK